MKSTGFLFADGNVLNPVDLRSGSSYYFFVTAKVQSALEALICVFFNNERMENSGMCFVASLIASDSEQYDEEKIVIQQTDSNRTNKKIHSEFYSEL